MLFVLFTTERMECENVDRFCSETFVEPRITQQTKS